MWCQLNACDARCATHSSALESVTIATISPRTISSYNIKRLDNFNSSKQVFAATAIKWNRKWNWSQLLQAFIQVEREKIAFLFNHRISFESGGKRKSRVHDQKIINDQKLCQRLICTIAAHPIGVLHFLVRASLMTDLEGANKATFT